MSLYNNNSSVNLIHITCMMQARETEKLFLTLQKQERQKLYQARRQERKKKCKTKEEKGPVIMVQGKLVAENTEKIS